MQSAAAGAGGEDVAADAGTGGAVRLWALRGDGDEEVAGPLARAALASDGVFLLLAGVAGYVWLGRAVRCAPRSGVGLCICLCRAARGLDWMRLCRTAVPLCVRTK